MAKQIKDILRHDVMLGTIQGIKGGIPVNVPPQFVNTNGGRTFQGTSGFYFRVENTRQVARVVQYSSPSEATKQKGVTKVAVSLLHTKEHIVHEPVVLSQIASVDRPEVQRMGEEEIDRQTAQFKQRFSNLKISCLYSLLTKGAVYFDEAGNILPTSSGAFQTVDFNVPAGNKTTLDVFGDGAIISASWATAGTDIGKQISNLKAAALKKTGYPLEYAFYGSNILSYLLANTLLGPIIQNNVGFQAAALKGEIADGFLGLKWRPINGSFFEDQNGDNQEWSAADGIVFTPEADATWLEWLRGTYPVPTSLALTGDAQEAAGNIVNVPGEFTYATIQNDPVSIKQVAGDTFLPTLKVPGAIFIADVTP